VYNLGLTAVHNKMGYQGDHEAALDSCSNNFRRICHTLATPRRQRRSRRDQGRVCQACHGANGNSVNPEWPSLAGLGADYIAEQLKNFKTGKRSNPVMMPMTVNLSADDMADLGMYFDSLTNTGLEADPSYWQAGEKLYRGGDQARGIPACMACHGPTGRAMSQQISGAAWSAFGLPSQAVE
jgi:cytochrome c553